MLNDEYRRVAVGTSKTASVHAAFPAESDTTLCGQVDLLDASDVGQHRLVTCTQCSTELKKERQRRSREGALVSGLRLTHLSALRIMRSSSVYSGEVHAALSDRRGRTLCDGADVRYCRKIPAAAQSEITCERCKKLAAEVGKEATGNELVEREEISAPGMTLDLALSAASMSNFDLADLLEQHALASLREGKMNMTQSLALSAAYLRGEESPTIPAWPKPASTLLTDNKETP